MIAIPFSYVLRTGFGSASDPLRTGFDKPSTHLRYSFGPSPHGWEDGSEMGGGWLGAGWEKIARRVQSLIRERNAYVADIDLIKTESIILKPFPDIELPLSGKFVGRLMEGVRVLGEINFFYFLINATYCIK